METSISRAYGLYIITVQVVHSWIILKINLSMYHEYSEYAEQMYITYYKDDVLYNINMCTHL